MKTKILLALIVGLYCHTFGQTNIVKTLPTGNESRIIYSKSERTFRVEMPDHNSSLNQFHKGEVFKKGFSFEAEQWVKVIGFFNEFLDYSNTLEDNKITNFSKTLGKVLSHSADGFGGITLEFTIQVGSQGESKLLLEETHDNFSSPALIVMDRSEARNASELIKLVPEIQKESAN